MSSPRLYFFPTLQVAAGNIFMNLANPEANRLKIGVVTISDRARSGVYEDRSGPAIVEYFSEVFRSEIQFEKRLIADEQLEIEATLKELADGLQCGLIVTTGGTGPALRDVTPEATAAVCQKILPGFGEQMRQVSLKYVPTAILSRQTAGIRGKSLILNLPGQPKAIRQCLDGVMPAIPYCLELIGWAYPQTESPLWQAFRPKQ
jgi:molybdopterin adenylyltransferase